MRFLIALSVLVLSLPFPPFSFPISLSTLILRKLILRDDGVLGVLGVLRTDSTMEIAEAAARAEDTLSLNFTDRRALGVLG